MHVSARNHRQAPQRVAARPAREHYLRERRSSFSTSSMAIIAVLARDEPWCACPRPPCPLALLILDHSSCRRFMRREAPRQNNQLLQVARSRSSTMRTASCISVLTPSIVLHSPPFPPQVHLVCFTMSLQCLATSQARGRPALQHRGSWLVASFSGCTLCASHVQ